jgi:dCMP deaminase
VERVRPSWDEYFLSIAREVSSRASCPRASVGAVLVRDSRILATGYNGAPSGEPHCLEQGCVMEDGHCQRALHAEVNAIAHAAAAGVSIKGSRLYLYDTNGRQPCRECSKVLTAAGVAFRTSHTHV